MATTPLWVPLLIAALGVTGTVGAVLLTQGRADRREAASWSRQLEREGARWAREDAARTFDHRRIAYSEFYESLRDMAFMAYNHGMGFRESKELESDWQHPTFLKMQHLQLYATPAVANAADAAYSVAWWWGHETVFGADDARFYERQKEWDEAASNLLFSIRRDLAIPDE